jgi:hypothetical protein
MLKVVEDDWGCGKRRSEVRKESRQVCSEGYFERKKNNKGLGRTVG